MKFEDIMQHRVDVYKAITYVIDAEDRHQGEEKSRRIAHFKAMARLNMPKKLKYKRSDWMIICQALRNAVYGMNNTPMFENVLLTDAPIKTSN
jgi:hypothetical protein